MARRKDIEARYAGSVSEVFVALLRTLSFRRWGLEHDLLGAAPPRPGLSYRHRTGSVLRQGRIVDVTRPIGLTLKEALHDPPCRVVLTFRWRIYPLPEGSSLSLNASYRLNHAAILRHRHWDARLERHFRKQFAFVAVNLDRMHEKPAAKRDLMHL